MCHYLDFIKSLPFDHIFNHVLVKYRHFRGMQILANEWADPNSASVKGTGCYKTISYASKQKGDIIAFKRNGTSGHVGIVSPNGKFISALRYKVENLDVAEFRSGDSSIVSTTAWRYTC